MNYELPYSPIDTNESLNINDSRTRSWRRLVASFQKEVSPYAHSEVINGLDQYDGLYRDVPTVERLNQQLTKFHWNVVEVNGFLPPKEYLNHIQNRRLPVDTSLRSLGDEAFCAAPDLFHEIFGHVGLLSNSLYSAFVQAWGAASCRAFQAPGEAEYYNGVRLQTMALNTQGPQFIDRSVQIQSEATTLARLGWWTVECGLFKANNSMKAYGAAVLSSPTEFRNSRIAPVKRASPEIFATPFDPTALQPTYFFIESFDELFDLLELATANMAFRKGGLDALSIAKISREEAVCIFQSGKKLRGIIQDYTVTNETLVLSVRTARADSVRSVTIVSIPVFDKILSVYPASAEFD